MIRIHRGAAPAGFSGRAADWRARYAAALDAPTPPTAATFWSEVRPEIAAAGDAVALTATAHGKCAYCEARMAHVSAPHIEHYRPKSRYPQEMFRWENWLISCGRCNEAKWAHFPMCGAAPCLLDPSNEEPYPHLHFRREQILPTSYRGHVTIRLLGLDRPPLDEERARWLVSLDLLLVILITAPPKARTHARTLLIWAMQPEAPYSLMAYCYLRRRIPRIADPPHPHPKISVADPLDQIASLLDAHQALLRAQL